MDNFYKGLLEDQIKMLEEELRITKLAKDRDALSEQWTGIFKGTKIGEPAPGETLLLHPSYHAENETFHSLYLAPVRGIVSFCTQQHYKNRDGDYAHFWFTREEVMILIKAFAEAIAMIERGEE